jgi:hypothetical protein
MAFSNEENSMSSTWFIRSNGKVLGPLDDQRVMTLAAEGKIDANTNVARNPNGPWYPASRVKGLKFDCFGSATAPAEQQTAPAPLAEKEQPSPQASVSKPSAPADAFKGCGVALSWIGFLMLALSTLVLAAPRLYRAAVYAVANQEYVEFNAKEVMAVYNLDEDDLRRVQVWNYGDIELIAVEDQQDERSGSVDGGQVVARNAVTEIRKPVTIPHLTPGVYVGKSNNVGDPYIDFGGVEVAFESTTWGTVKSDSHNSGANALKKPSDPWDGVSVRIKKNAAGNEYPFDEWRCRFRNDALPPAFLVYKGGMRTDEKKVKLEEEKRAAGRVVE